MSKKLKNTAVYVRNFEGAKIRCMTDRVKPSLRENYIVLHVGTNDLDSDQPPDLIGKSKVDVASSMKNEKHDVTVSNKITRADHFKKKVSKVNDYSSKLCMEKNIYLINNWKTLKTQHLNGNKLHLNRRGGLIFQNTLCKSLSKNLNWCFEENSAEIATVSSIAPQSDKESTLEVNQMANEENTKYFY